MTYNQADVKVADGLESNYIPAYIYENDTYWDKTLPTTNINTIANTIEFPFTSAGDANITGDYTAGIPNAIPDEVPTYETTGTGGDFTASTTWNPVGSAPAITDGVGPLGAIIVVKNGDVLTLDENSARIYRTEIEGGSTIVVDGTIGHRLGIVTGSGDIRIVSNTSSAVLPSGFYEDFFSCTGGGLEYDGTGSYDILGGVTSVRNLTLSGSGNRTLPSNDVTVCNDLTVDGPIVENANDRTVNVQNDLIVNSGTYDNRGGMLTVSNDLNINGGAFSGGTGDQTINGNITLASGSITVGTDNTLSVGGDITYSSGTFQGGSGNAILELNGSVTQAINGNFTGANGFHRLQINNASGISISGNVDVADELILDNGIVTTNSNTFTLAQTATVNPTGGSSNSYINGRLHKVIASGGGFIFPVGSGTRYGKIGISSVVGVTETWYAEYYNANAVNQGAVANFTATNATTTETISENEYWIVGDNAPSVGTLSAYVELRWDASSDVSANSADHSELHVVAWDSGSSSWDDFGGTGHSQITQTFKSLSRISFSENVVTLGSGTAANPLPVELLNFTAQTKEDQVVLSWQTASETDNDFFEVQRSGNGSEWEVIGTVEGAGYSTSLLDYRFTDSEPLPGTNYYRLRQVDFNGMFEYSQVRSTVYDYSSVNVHVVEVRVYPNPAEGAFNVQVKGLTGNDPVTVKLIDLFGQTYEYTQTTGEALSRGVPINQKGSLASGLYFVNIQQGNITLQRKLIIR